MLSIKETSEADLVFWETPKTGVYNVFKDRFEKFKDNPSVSKGLVQYMLRSYEYDVIVVNSLGEVIAKNFI